MKWNIILLATVSSLQLSTHGQSFVEVKKSHRQPSQSLLHSEHHSFEEKETPSKWRPDGNGNLNRSGGSVESPLPIIYVHGLVGDRNSWDEMANEFLSPVFGEAAYLEFCLNADGSIYSADAEEDIIPHFSTFTIPATNQYIVDFNCSASGVCSTSGSISFSNQSAIYKQGEALGYAIQAVRNKTGADKVILVGHSMGGVACREYLQNSEHWYSSEHRIAKLLTSGSPHVGFDLGSGAAKLGGLFAGIDADSEAVRDLKNRHTGFLEWVPGVYFWGGDEDQDYMYDDIFLWHNVDVNCNGILQSGITGLNQRAFPQDLDYSSLWDTFDVVVSSFSAYYNWAEENSGGENLCSVLETGWLYPEPHTCESWGWDVLGGITEGHNELPEQVIETLWALDEPDEYELAYPVEFNTTYAGFVTPQANDGNYTLDYDDYLVDVPNGTWNLTVYADFLEGTAGDDFYIYDLDEGEYIAQELNVGASEVLETVVDGGNYLIEFSGIETNSQQFSQYFWRVELSPVTSVNETTTATPTVLYDAEQNSILITSSTCAACALNIFDSMGRCIFSEMTETISHNPLPTLSKGSYIAQIQLAESVSTVRFVAN